MSDAEKWRVSEHSLFGKRYIHLERWINSPAHWAIVAVIPVSDMDTASRFALAQALYRIGLTRLQYERIIAAIEAAQAYDATAAEEPPHGP